MNTIGINHVTVEVNDKAKAAEFYFDVLGLEKVMKGSSLWARVGDQYIHINENPNHTRVESFAHFAIAVSDLIPYLQNLIAKGVDVFDFDQNGNVCEVNQDLHKEKRNYFVRDPFGNLVEFVDRENEFFKGNRGNAVI